MINKYPVLKDKFQIYQGKNVSFVRNLETSIENNEYEINESSVDIIKECNGMNTFEEIISNLALTYDRGYAEIKDIIFDFIEDNPIFEINEKPLKIPFSPIKGSADLQIPLMFSIELTNYCNYFCKHCYNNSGPKNNEFINMDGLIEFLDYLKDFNPVIELTGGEPFAHPNIQEIIDYCCRNFGFVKIFTNGSLVKKHIEFLSKYDNLVLLISVYSYKVEYMNQFTKTKGYFDIVMNNIEKLVKNGVSVGGDLITTPVNLKDMYLTVKIMKDKGVDFVRMGVIMPIGRAKNKNLDFTSENIDEFNKEFERIAEDFAGFIEKNPEYLLEDMNDKANCGITTNVLSIKYNGEVIFCPVVPEDFNIGNVFKESPESFFKKIAKCNYYQVPAPKKEFCGDCKEIIFCKGCISRGLHAQKENHDCIWYEKIFKPLKDPAEKIMKIS